LAFALVSVLRFIVPRGRRATWLAEWRGELSYLSSIQEHTAKQHEPARRSPDVLTYSLHAIRHAAAHRGHEWRPEMLMQDVRYAVRRLSRSPGFTAVAMLTIAIGVGANTAIFGVVNSTLIDPLPYPNADRIVYLWRQAPAISLMTTPSGENVVAWREQATSFEEIQVYDGGTFTLTGGEEPRELLGLRVLPGFFEFLGVQPAVGREFSEEEARLGENVVVLSDGLWRTHLGADENVLGRTLMLDDEPHVVIGVMSPDFHFQAPFDDTQLWLPMSEEQAAEERSPFAMARLAPGVSTAAANEELVAIAASESEQTGEEVWSGIARRPQDLFGDTFRTSLVALQAAVAIVLLIACANVANLLLARGTTQREEMAMRAAIGASRRRLFRQLLTEHFLLAAAGGLLGYGLARASVALIMWLRPEELTGLALVRVDGRVFLFAVVVASLTGLAFGALPAWQASKLDFSTRLRRLGRTGSAGRGSIVLRNGLVAAEVALAPVLLVVAGLLLSSFGRLLDADLGFDTDDVLTMSLSLPEGRYADDVQRAVFREELEARIRQVAGPRLEGIAVSGGRLPTMGILFGTYAAEGEEPLPAFTDMAAHAGWVSPGFFGVLGIDLLAGRDFSTEDADSSERRVIVNAAWAARMWGDGEAVGRRIVDMQSDSDSYTVVGVVEDAKLAGPVGGLGDLHIFFPQVSFAAFSLLVRTSDDPRTLIDGIKQQIWALDADLPIMDVALLESAYAGRLASQRFNLVLMGIFAAIALSLALIGVYGVLSYSVGRRTHEIGIRVALGARRKNVVPMIAWQGMRMVLLGVLIGIAGAVAATRFIESLLFEVSAIDPLTYLAVVVALVVVALLACLVPALRAARLDAMEALRRA
jgi:putative ABC transport system permease protein